MSNISEQYLNYYNKFIEQLLIIFDQEEIKNILDNLYLANDEKKITNGISLASSLNDFNFNLFLKEKIKVFSHKNNDTLLISESLFGKELALKNLLNNQPEDVRIIIWRNLHTICMASEYLKSEDIQNHERIELLKKELSKYSFNAQEKIQEILNIDINENTNELINEIVDSFEGILNSSDGNPLNEIVNISQILSDKYSEKIISGDIEISKILEAIFNKIPGINNIMSSMGGISGLGNILQAPKNNKITVIDENFSTADIEIENDENNSDISTNIKIGNVLKMADQFGVIPGGKNTQNNVLNLGNLNNLTKDSTGIPDLMNNMPDLSNLFGGQGGMPDLSNLFSGKGGKGGKGMPDLSNLFGGKGGKGMPDLSNLFGGKGNKGKGMPDLNKMINMIGKISNINNEDNANDLKVEMEDFLKNDLNIDIEKLNLPKQN